MRREQGPGKSKWVDELAAPGSYRCMHAAAEWKLNAYCKFAAQITYHSVMAFRTLYRIKCNTKVVGLGMHPWTSPSYQDAWNWAHLFRVQGAIYSIGLYGG